MIRQQILLIIIASCVKFIKKKLQQIYEKQFAKGGEMKDHFLFKM